MDVNVKNKNQPCYNWDRMPLHSNIEFNFSRFVFSYSDQKLSQSVNQLFTTLLNFNGFL